MMQNVIILGRDSGIIVLTVVILMVYSAPTNNLFVKIKNGTRGSSSPNESTEMLQDLTTHTYSDNVPVHNHSTGLGLIVKNGTAEGDDGALPNEELIRIDHKSKANLGTVLNVSEVSVYDYSDLEKKEGQDEDEYFQLEKNATAEPTSSTPLTEASNLSTLATTTFKPTEALATTMSYNVSTESSLSLNSTSTTENPGTQKPNADVPTTTSANQSTPESQSLDLATDESEPGNTTESTPQNMNTTTNTSDDSNHKIAASGKTTTTTAKVPIVVYDNDPMWYGDPNFKILDDYEVYLLRGCVDFSCKDDF